MANNKFSPVGDWTMNRIVSAHELKDDVLPMLYKQYDTFGNMFIDTYIRSFNGLSRPVTSPISYHGEKVDPDTTLKLNAQATLAQTTVANDTIVFVLSADSLSSTFEYSVRLGWKINFGNNDLGFLECQIIDIADDGNGTITVKAQAVSMSSGVTPAQLLASGVCLEAGVEVQMTSSAFAVETDQPKGLYSKIEEFASYTQIFKESTLFGPRDLHRLSWFADKNGSRIYSDALFEAERRLDLQQNAAYLMGQANNSSITQTSAASTGQNTVYMTEGLWTKANLYGGELTYTDAAMFDLDDFNSAGDYLKSQRVNSKCIVWLCSQKFMQNVDSVFFDYARGTAGGLNTNFTQLKGNPAVTYEPSMFLNIGFYGVQYGGYYHIFFELPEFSDPKMLGIAGYQLNGSAIGFPMQMVKDTKSGLQIPNIHEIYIENEGYSRKRIMDSFAGMDGYLQQKYGIKASHTADYNKTGWLAETGLRVAEANKLILWKYQGAS